MTADVWSEESGPEAAALVVLIHGSMDRSAGLLKLSRRLDDDHRVARYDRRGYGRSAPHDGPFDVARQVDDLLAVMAGRSAVLFGHSYGGNVALTLAAQQPDVVRAVVVYESPLSWLPWWPTTTAGGQALDGMTDPADAAERFMRRLVGDAKWERLSAGTRAARRREGVAMVGELANLRAAAPWDPADVRVPVTAIRGSGGADHHRRSVEYIASSVDGARLVVVEGARHFGPNTHPTEVADVIRHAAACSIDGATG
ncbi:MAG: alpha/beta hydrolase [Actinomycetota bacterium]|nr:alpha/beta hydrolase [Actinomycetota bacterium]